MRKFFTQDIGTNTLELFNYFMNRYCWIGRNKYMNMVGHNFKSNNINLYLFRFILDNLQKLAFYFADKNRSSSFWTPYQMIIDKIYMMFAMLIFHVDNISHINIVVKNEIQGKAAIHPLTKVRGFLA